MSRVCHNCSFLLTLTSKPRHVSSRYWFQPDRNWVPTWSKLHYLTDCQWGPWSEMYASNYNCPNYEEKWELWNYKIINYTYKSYCITKSEQILVVHIGDWNEKLECTETKFLLKLDQIHHELLKRIHHLCHNVTTRTKKYANEYKIPSSPLLLKIVGPVPNQHMHHKLSMVSFRPLMGERRSSSNPWFFVRIQRRGLLTWLTPSIHFKVCRCYSLRFQCSPISAN
jgi:hypothetical protein